MRKFFSTLGPIEVVLALIVASWLLRHWALLEGLIIVAAVVGGGAWFLNGFARSAAEGARKKLLEELAREGRLRPAPDPEAVSRLARKFAKSHTDAEQAKSAAEKAFREGRLGPTRRDGENQIRL